jgi:hypothetical protein
MIPNNKILLYDDYCPLCTWYSGLFVRFGLLKPANRVAFSKVDISVLTSIDIEKGKNEIPLFDPVTRQTLYGIDALLEILGHKFPFIKNAGNIKPVKWFLKKLYKLVSYNRKVIVARKCGPGTIDCSPAFNSSYRIVFLVIFLVFNSLMLFPLHNQVFNHLSFYRLSSMQLQAGHFVFVVINCLLAMSLGRRTAIEYLGQLNILALVSILLLLGLMFLSFVFPISERIIVVCLASIIAFVIKEYRRRMKYAGIFSGHKTIVGINIACLAVFLVYVFH